MPWALAGGMAASGIASGLLGAGAQKAAAREAADAMKAMYGQYIAKLDAVGMPPDQSAAIILNQYKEAGQLTPELEQLIQASASEYNQIKTDQKLRDIQNQALERMSVMGRAGLTPDERAAMRQAQAQVAQQGQATQQAIIQNLAARGQAGGGAEIAARLGASQAASQQMSEAADRASAMGAQRALQALASTGGMAGQMEQQRFGQEAQRAQAADVMNRFNVEAQIGRQQRNIAASNVAQAANLQNLQRIRDANVAQANQELYNQQARQRQYWADKLQYAQSYGMPLGGMAQASAQQAQQVGQATANMWQGIGQAVTGGLGYVGQQQNFDKMLAAKESAPMASSVSRATFNPNVTTEDVTGSNYRGFGSNWNRY